MSTAATDRGRAAGLFLSDKVNFRTDFAVRAWRAGVAGFQVHLGILRPQGWDRIVLSCRLAAEEAHCVNALCVVLVA